MDIQLHILILLVDDIEIASVISAKSIFFVERFLKVLKIFARQKSWSEGSMGDGYIVQESIFYEIEYISQIHPSAPKVWQANKDIKKFEGEILEYNGINYIIKGTKNIKDITNL